MTPALIRCAGKTPEQAIDIMVQSDGGITSLGEVLSTICKDILYGHHILLDYIDERDPERRIRLGFEENLGAMVFGLLWPHWDQTTSIPVRSGEITRRWSHNKFVIGPVNDDNLDRAYYVYHLEFRDYPGLYLESEGIKRVWINITNDALETLFEGWPEHILRVVEAENAKEELLGE
jgi:hypothetical protein